MPVPDSKTWNEHTSGRERVRTVVETLADPASVSEIADQADVAWATADSELERLLTENQIRQHEIDGQTKYDPDPVQQFLDGILELIEENDRDELETQLVEYQSRLEALRDEHEVHSASEFRERLTSDDRSADALREIRAITATWEALETERRLTKQALNLYEDVSRFADSDDHGVVSA